MRILVVEDEPSVATGVERALVGAGYRVDVVLDGGDGLTQARSGQYDLLVLDIMLPTVNGYEICRDLRAEGNWTPILILTAKSGEFDEAEGLELGADDYLTKPFAMVVLLARVAALLRRPRAKQDRPFTAGDLSIDPARHRCWRGDDEIELTAREMEVLAFLVRRAGDVVGKLDLVDHVWGEDFHGNPNIAEVYIRHLRRKIDAPYGRQSIRTVRGVGYQLDPDERVVNEPRRSGRTRSIQFRVTLIATMAVAALLALTAVVLIRSFENRLIDQADEELAADALVVRRSIANESVLEVRRAGAAIDLIVQVLGGSGRVVSGTAIGRDLPPLVDVSTLGADDIGTIRTVEVTEVGRVRLLVEPLADRPAVIVVGRSVERVDDAVASLRRLGLVVIPVVAALLAALMWWVVGRSLRPVEAVRRRVGSISEHDLSERLPVPDTGDEVARLVETMNGLLARVDRAVARERRFVADASHELRSPLAGARALLETEADDPAGVADTRVETLATIARLESVIDQLLQLARPDGETIEREPRRPVDLDELVLAQATRLRRTTDLDIDTSGVSGGQVRGRDNELGRLIENLTSNAVRHARSTVGLSVVESDGWVELAISDDGPGVPESDRARIFQRFARLDDSRVRDAGGAGLGLAIVEAIVRDHGGAISVERSDSGGARFVVRLPSSAADA